MGQLLLPGDAGFSDVLSGKKFSAGVNYNAVGSMPNNGAVAITPGASSQAIAAGYHNGSGAVAAVSVPAANVLVGTTIAGTAGTMPNRGTVNFTPSTSNQTIANGYHSGSGIVSGDANLVAANILSGISIFGVAGNVTARKYASGTASSEGSSTVWRRTDGSTLGLYGLTVGGLTFTATLIFIWKSSASQVEATVWANGTNLYPGGSYAGDVFVGYYNAGYGANLAGGTTGVGYVNGTGFKMPVSLGGSYSWVAYG